MMRSKTSPFPKARNSSAFCLGFLFKDFSSQVIGYISCVSNILKKISSKISCVATKKFFAAPKHLAVGYPKKSLTKIFDQNALEYLAFGKDFYGDRIGDARNLNQNLENNL